MKIISEIEERVLREVYPKLSLTDDLDIERYFELRKIGRMSDAISLYNSRLRRKYPNDDMRIKLLGFYRAKDPRFGVLLTESLLQLANRTIERFKRVIGYITDKTMYLDLNDVFAIIQVCESLVSAISKDRLVSIGETQKYARFAKIIGFRVDEMKNAAELIRLYVTDSLSSVQAFRSQQSEAKRLEQAKRDSYTPQKVFDFSKVIFSKEQKEAIILPPGVQSVEDKVLVYIMKYWHNVFNGAFENLVLMFSRKYKTDHYTIFKTVQTARARNWQDDEILHSVLASVSSGYYYSISGDLYLHRNWMRIKANLLSSNNQNKLSIIPARKNLLVKAPPVLITDSSEQKRSTSILNSNTKVYKANTGKKLAADSNALILEQKKQEVKYEQLKREEAKWAKTASKTISVNAQKYAEQQKRFLESQRRVAKKSKSTVTVKSKVSRKVNIATATNDYISSTQKPVLNQPQKKQNVVVKAEKQIKRRLKTAQVEKVKQKNEVKPKKLVNDKITAEQIKDRDILSRVKEKTRREILRNHELEKQAKQNVEKKHLQVRLESEQKKQQAKYEQLKKEEAKWSKTTSKTIISNAEKYAVQQKRFLESEKQNLQKPASIVDAKAKQKMNSKKQARISQTESQMEIARKKRLEAMRFEALKKEKEIKARKIVAETRKAELARDREIQRKVKEKSKQEILRKRELETKAKQSLEKKQAKKVAEEKILAKKTQQRQKKDIKRTASLEKKANKKPNIFIPNKTGLVDISKTQSIEQMIRRATGKTYVLYKDIFFKSVRNSIRYVLDKSSRQKHSLFGSDRNTAENIIYLFLERNYDNLYQNWQESTARQEVDQLGYRIDKLNTIINHWVKTELH